MIFPGKIHRYYGDNMSKHVPWLVQVAQAALTWDNLVFDGVCGRLQVEGLAQIKRVHAAVLLSGWDRCHDLEKKQSYTSKIEYRVYSRMFDYGRRWMTMTAGSCMGAFCDIEVRKTPLS